MSEERKITREGQSEETLKMSYDEFKEAVRQKAYEYVDEKASCRKEWEQRVDKAIDDWEKDGSLKRGWNNLVSVSAEGWNIMMDA